MSSEKGAIKEGTSMPQARGCGKPGCTCENCSCAAGQCHCGESGRAGNLSDPGQGGNQWQQQQGGQGMKKGCGKARCTCDNCGCPPGQCRCGNGGPGMSQGQQGGGKKGCGKENCGCDPCNCGGSCKCDSAGQGQKSQ
ncbi:hypothetical protein RvY_12590-1 [Ramazzottius varieornatus]|uniref:Uncharacterized protein n=1 Tax=Ramazzottius varieornatus TaxID=947166 RepID=A0A1D1VQH0_RAMVA|nr:hypothetical protein RvY_12590-1 [Ramazzottius varieornatus]